MTVTPPCVTNPYPPSDTEPDATRDKQRGCLHRTAPRADERTPCSHVSMKVIDQILGDATAG